MSTKNDTGYKFVIKQNRDGEISMAFCEYVGDGNVGACFLEMDGEHGARIVEETGSVYLAGDDALKHAEKYFEQHGKCFDIEHIEGQIAYFNALEHDEKLAVLPQDTIEYMLEHDPNMEGEFRHAVKESEFNFSVLSGDMPVMQDDVNDGVSRSHDPF